MNKKQRSLIIDPKISECRHSWRPFGRFFRRSDSEWIKRFRCCFCGKTNSEATYDPCFRQKKRHINHSLFGQLVSGVSQRRCALLHVINRKTVVKKFIWLGSLAKAHLEKQNKDWGHLVTCFEFDDMETFEHSKCKPLSITLIVESKVRRILDFRVSRMPAKGLLAKIARKKYGFRKDERKNGRQKLFESIQKFITPEVVVKSDQNPHYSADVKEHFPNSKHLTFKGRRGCVVGQGELKGGGFDPLFSLNHTAAQIRADINRLFRRTWCTTKKPERLTLHIYMMSVYHNYKIQCKHKQNNQKFNSVRFFDTCLLQR